MYDLEYIGKPYHNDTQIENAKKKTIIKDLAIIKLDEGNYKAFDKDSAEWKTIEVLNDEQVNKFEKMVQRNKEFEKEKKERQKAQK